MHHDVVPPRMHRMKSAKFFSYWHHLEFVPHTLMPRRSGSLREPFRRRPHSYQSRKRDWSPLPAVRMAPSSDSHSRPLHCSRRNSRCAASLRVLFFSRRLRELNWSQRGVVSRCHRSRKCCWGCSEVPVFSWDSLIRYCVKLCCAEFASNAQCSDCFLYCLASLLKCFAILVSSQSIWPWGDYPVQMRIDRNVGTGGPLGYPVR